MAFLKGRTDANPEKINEVLTRGVEEVIEKESLEKKLLSGEKLRIKHGIDPTGPSIHLGRAFQFWKLKSFQDLGHQIILIIGDFTAQIGDASDKKAMRRPLSEKEVRENMKNYLPQIGRILDLKNTEVCRNSQWLEKLKAKDLISLQMKFTAQQMIQRRNFKERWEEGKEIGLHELTYPLLQGYDSVAVRADVETGGSDQLFNLLAGRKIQEGFGMAAQDILTTRMLSGLDARKMSTSWGNVINISDPAYEIFGKIMSMRDEMLMDYFLLATRLSQEEIGEKKKRLEQGENPRDLKMELAFEVVKLYYGAKEAEESRKDFVRVFQKGGAPEKIQEIVLKKPKLLSEVLLEKGMVASKSECRRLTRAGAIEFNSEIVKEPDYAVKKSGLLRIGKKKFLRVVWR